MAHVNPLRAGGRDRGQMLLIAAFGVAVMLVALALILNTAIYTENIATRGSDISGGKDATRFRAVLETSLDRAVNDVNRYNNTTMGGGEDYSTVTEPARHAVWNLSNMTGRLQATDTIVANLSVKPYSPSEGTHVFQRSDLNLSNESGDADWTVATDAHGVRKFSMNVTQASTNSLATGSAGTGDTVFFVNFSDRTTDYHVFVYDDSGNLVVEVHEDGTDLGTCSEPYETLGGSDRATVNFTNGSIQGTQCSLLTEWWDLQGAPFSMHFNNTCYDTSTGGLISTCTVLDAGPTTEGEFSFLVNSSINETNVDAGTGTVAVDNPNATAAVYSVTVRMTYESKRLFYASDVRAAPGETDE